MEIGARFKARLHIGPAWLDAGSDQAEFGALLDGRPVVKSRGFGLNAARNFNLRGWMISQVHCTKEFVQNHRLKILNNGTVEIGLQIGVNGLSYP